MDFRRKIIVILMIVSVLSGNLVFSESDDSSEKPEKAVIYYNEACRMCAIYIKEELPQILESLGISEVLTKDYINERKNRKELNKLNDELKVPYELQGHIMTFIDEKVILSGHVPKEVILGLFKKENLKRYDKIVVFQDEMHEPKNYKVWAFKGEIKEYEINVPIENYLDWFEQNRESLITPSELQSKEWKFETLLPIVLATGLLDGINPCAFAVLLFFLSFLYTIGKITKGNIFKLGVVYISAIYIVYFLIGIGLLKAILISGTPHLMARIGAYFVILLGLINLKDYFFPHLPIHLRAPSFSRKVYRKWIYKATLPSAFVAGFLVGLCVFPCSGGIYVAIVGLLASQSTQFQGIMYLLIYNVMFVLPLVAILVVASNRRVVGKLIEWEERKVGYMKLLSGLVMVALGVIILIWFV